MKTCIIVIMVVNFYIEYILNFPKYAQGPVFKNVCFKVFC